MGSTKPSSRPSIRFSIQISDTGNSRQRWKTGCRRTQVFSVPGLPAHSPKRGDKRSIISCRLLPTCRISLACSPSPKSEKSINSTAVSNSWMSSDVRTTEAQLLDTVTFFKGIVSGMKCPSLRCLSSELPDCPHSTKTVGKREDLTQKKCAQPKLDANCLGGGRSRFSRQGPDPVGQCVITSALSK